MEKNDLEAIAQRVVELMTGSSKLEHGVIAPTTVTEYQQVDPTDQLNIQELLKGNAMLWSTWMNLMHGAALATSEREQRLRQQEELFTLRLQVLANLAGISVKELDPDLSESVEGKLQAGLAELREAIACVSPAS